MIYLNNAPSVIAAMTEAMETVPESSLRSSYTGSADLLSRLRQRIGSLLHVCTSDRIYFTSGATDAINRILGGLGDIDILASSDCHNSVLRPAYNLTNIRKVDIISSNSLENIPLTSKRKERTTILILPHCSNVTGHVYDIRRMSDMAHERGMLVMADVAQSAGCIPIDVDNWGVDIVVFTGHKSLLGPQGTGGYYIRHGIPLHPTVFGGTGRDSSVVRYDTGDWEYEVGTQNLPGLAGLLAGVEYVLQQGVEHIWHQEQELTHWLIGQLKAIQHVKVFCEENNPQGPVISFNIGGLQPADAGYILQNTYGIILRTGLHCAPLIHQELGTAPWGTLRVSLSLHTTLDELKILAGAVRDISDSL